MHFLSLSSLFKSPPPITRGRTDEEEHDIARTVRSHCRKIGCDESNTVAAIAWALRSPGATLTAIRFGNQRADQLRQRQKLPPPRGGLIA
jgi:hypothetical protein